MVGEAGIEPTTPGLEGRCSIRLSYSPTLFIVAVKRPIARRGGRGSDRSDSLKVTDDGGLGPVNAVAGRRAEEGAVASVAGLDKGDVGIGEEARAGFRKEADERIVLRAEDERGNGDAVDDAGAGGAVVVVVGVAEAAIARDDLLVELADGANGADAARFDRCRERAPLCG